MSNQINNLYFQLLNVTKDIKSNIMLTLAEEIPFLTNMPPKIIKELDLLASIDGLVASILQERGTSLIPVQGKEEYLNIKDSSFLIHKSKLISLTDEESTPQIKEETKEEKKEESFVNNVDLNNKDTNDKENKVENNSMVFIPPETQKSGLSGLETFLQSEQQGNNESQNEVFHSESLDQVENIQTETSKEQNTSDIPETTDNTKEIIPEDKKEVTTESLESLKATIIGGDYVAEPIVAPIAKKDIFTEEKKKAYSDFVFDSYRASIYHIGNKAEDMQIMIAPLKIQKVACPTVPIIVAVYYKGKIYSASSFDKNEDGRNIVTIDVNDYNLLCRGSFNEAGKFQSSVATTGISANLGDKLNIISCKRHNPTGTSVKNGHLKFRYKGEDGPGIIEIFPMEIGEKDFVIMTRCGEFVDYYALAAEKHGLNRVLLYDDGIRSEVICTWDKENNLEAEIIPV